MRYEVKFQAIPKGVVDMPRIFDRIINYMFFATLILMSISLALREDYNFIFSPAIMGVAYAGFLWFEQRNHYHLRFSIRLYILLTIIAHNVIGEYLYAYERSSYFDKFLHLFGTFSFALFTYSIAKDFITVRTSRPFLFTFLLVSALGLSLGTLFELAEFSLDVIFSEHNQRSLIDTNLDIIFDLIGTCVAAFYLSIRDPLKKI